MGIIPQEKVNRTVPFVFFVGDMPTKTTKNTKNKL